MSEDLIAEAITEAFGERCPDYEPGCFCCKAWRQYDRLKCEADDIRAAARREIERITKADGLPAERE